MEATVVALIGFETLPLRKPVMSSSSKSDSRQWTLSVPAWPVEPSTGTFGPG